jgi:cytoskeletal protein CcmA (bactofilin family)
MFSKKDRLGSLVGSGASFTGEIKMNGTLRVDGKVTGNVHTDWLIVGEKASLRGNVSARVIIVGGSIEGDLNARELVEIKPKGHVKGDVLTKKLVVAEGGFIDGRVSMQREESKIIEMDKAKAL